MKNKKLITIENKREIFWNFVNSALAGGLVFFGSIADGEITKQGIFAAIAAGLIVVLTKFKDYWKSEKKEYTTKLFKFV